MGDTIARSVMKVEVHQADTIDAPPGLESGPVEPQWKPDGTERMDCLSGAASTRPSAATTPRSGVKAEAQVAEQAEQAAAKLNRSDGKGSPTLRPHSPGPGGGKPLKTVKLQPLPRH